MRILGVDPGLHITGYAILDEMELVNCGKIHLKGDWKESLFEASESLKEKVKELRPDEVALESSFAGVNPSSSLKLAHLRGAIIYMSMLFGLRVYDYSPATVKKSITGKGDASKTEVRNYIRRIFRQVEGYDEADAVAVAFAHYLVRSHDRKVERKSH